MHASLFGHVAYTLAFSFWQARNMHFVVKVVTLLCLVSIGQANCRLAGKKPCAIAVVGSSDRVEGEDPVEVGKNKNYSINARMCTCTVDASDMAWYGNTEGQNSDTVPFDSSPGRQYHIRGDKRQPVILLIRLSWSVCTTPPVMTTVSSSSLVFCRQGGESDDAFKVNDLTPQNLREATSMLVSAILN